MNLKTTAEVTEVVAHVATALAAMAAAWWFFRSSRAKPRLVFDLDCQFLPLRGNPGQLVAELQMIIENKGSITHVVRELFISVYTLKSEEELQEENAKTKALLFSKPVLSDVDILDVDPEDPSVRGVSADRRKRKRSLISTFSMQPKNCDTLLMVGSSFPYAEFLPKEGQARGVQIEIDGKMPSIRYPMEVPLMRGDGRLNGQDGPSECRRY